MTLARALGLWFLSVVLTAFYLLVGLGIPLLVVGGLSRLAAWAHPWLAGAVGS